MRKRLAYWRRVGARAWAEAVATSAWSSPVRVISAIAAAVVGAGSGLAATGKLAMAGIWGLAGIGAVLVLAVLFKLLWAVPADLDDEATGKARELQAKLDSYSGPEEDVWLLDAIGFMQLGEWGRGSDARTGDPFQFEMRLTELERAAHKEHIHVWGRRVPGARHTLIPHTYWECEGFDLASALAGDDALVKTTKSAPNANSRYWEPMLNRAEIEREFARSAYAVAGAT